MNHLSDSVSIVDLSGAAPRVTRTLLLADEPRDIVFAGPGNSRAFITAAHRGQNGPYTDPANPGELTSPGVGRTDVWVLVRSVRNAARDRGHARLISCGSQRPAAPAVGPVAAGPVTPSGSRVTEA